MKIAILLIGQFRNHEQCFDNCFNKLVKPNNADVFIVTESENDHEKNQITKFCNNKYGSHLKSLKIIKPFYFMKKHGKMKMNKKFHQFCKEMGNNDTIGHGSPREQYIKLYLCFNLLIKYQKDAKIKYDYIIKTRMDLELKDQFKIQDYISNDDDLKLYTLLNKTDLVSYDNENLWLHYYLMDQFYFGNLKTMTIIKNLIMELFSYYLDLPDYILKDHDKYYLLKNSNYYSIESFLIIHCMYHKIQLENIPKFLFSFKKKDMEMVWRKSFDDSFCLNIFPSKTIQQDKSKLLKK